MSYHGSGNYHLRTGEDVMMVLLVEDDEFKAADLTRLLHENLPPHQVTRAASVTSALRAITSDRFDLVVLDMSLPTFDPSGPGGGGVSTRTGRC